jgi:hypothetical protein
MLVRFVLGLSLVVASWESPQTSEPFVVALLQANGSLIPVAAYDGQWRATWPEPGAAATAGINALGDLPREWTGRIPVPTAWRLWMTTGSSHELRVSRPAFVDSVCSRNWVLTSDFPPERPTCVHCCPRTTIGIALSTMRSVVVPRAARGSALPMRVIEPSFNEHEDREVEASIARGHAAGARLRYTAQPLDVAERRAAPIRIEQAWTSNLPDATAISYAEMVRSYAGPDGGCEGVTLFQVWLRSPSGPSRQAHVLSARVTLVDCDRKGPEFDRPLAVVALPDGPHAIVERLGWDSQEVAVLRLDATDVVTRIRARVR